MAKSNPSSSTGVSSRLWFVRAVLATLLVAPFVVFPPVRFVSLKAAKAAAKANLFNAHDFAATFWQEKLLPGLNTAVDAKVLDEALAADPANAAKKYARLVGIGGTTYYLISGEGTVTAADDDAVTLTITGRDQSSLILDVGLIFGNALRDGTGLLDVNRFANSEEYNAIAAELNTIVESTVLPVAHAKGKVGAKLKFVGIAEITGTTGDPRPLHLIPIKVETSP